MRFIDFISKQFKIDRDQIPKNIVFICDDSRKVKKDSLFVAIKGRKEDGHNYIKEAIQNGAIALLVEDSSSVPQDFKGLVLKTENVREQLPQILNEFYNFPSEKLFTVGVTGTNGKTSIAHMIEHIYSQCGWPTAVVGTIDQHFKETKWPALLTTPNSVKLFRRLQDFINLGAKSCVMEVSSIGLDQNRLGGIHFNCGIFTNLSLDHMDYHLSLEDYFQAKKKLFIENKDKNFFSVINKDDEYGKTLIKELKTKTYSYGMESSDFTFKITNQDLLKTEFDLQTPFGNVQVQLPLTGIYNVYNAVASLACASVSGFSLEDCVKAIESFKGVPGRLQQVTSANHPFQVFVDYAHTPLALSSVLESLKSFKKSKLIVVFGCGGDRDKSKRPEMMAEVLKFSDKVFLTSDNPRTEDPLEIIKDTLKGLSQEQLKIVSSEVSRKKAIGQAIDTAQKGDIVLIAGKGHEEYQIIGSTKTSFSDVEVAKSFLNK